MTVHARPRTVFRFFSDPARFARWWACPGGGEATIEPTPGGEVRIKYQGGAVMAGRVVEIVPDERFVMTWGYESGNAAVPAGGSRVEVTLRAVPEGTLLTLRHTGLPTPEQVQGHRSGWRHYLAVVAGECSKDQFGPLAADLVRDWFAAWSATDDAARESALTRCCEPDVDFRDAWSCVQGVPALSAHVANALRHMPGVALTPVGELTLIHSSLRQRWSMSNVPGMGSVQGENVYRLSPDGRISHVVGFWG